MEHIVEIRMPYTNAIPSTLNHPTITLGDLAEHLGRSKCPTPINSIRYADDNGVVYEVNVGEGSLYLLLRHGDTIHIPYCELHFAEIMVNAHDARLMSAVDHSETNEIVFRPLTANHYINLSYCNRTIGTRVDGLVLDYSKPKQPNNALLELLIGSFGVTETQSITDFYNNMESERNYPVKTMIAMVDGIHTTIAFTNNPTSSYFRHFDVATLYMAKTTAEINFRNPSEFTLFLNGQAYVGIVAMTDISCVPVSTKPFMTALIPSGATHFLPDGDALQVSLRNIVHGVKAQPCQVEGFEKWEGDTISYRLTSADGSKGVLAEIIPDEEVNPIVEAKKATILLPEKGRADRSTLKGTGLSTGSVSYLLFPYLEQADKLKAIVDFLEKPVYYVEQYGYLLFPSDNLSGIVLAPVLPDCDINNCNLTHYLLNLADRHFSADEFNPTYINLIDLLSIPQIKFEN